MALIPLSMTLGTMPKHKIPKGGFYFEKNQCDIDLLFLFALFTVLSTLLRLLYPTLMKKGISFFIFSLRDGT